MAGQSVYVQCFAFRLLGYLDSLGIWRDYYHNQELTDVIGWRMLEIGTRT